MVKITLQDTDKEILEKIREEMKMAVAEERYEVLSFQLICKGTNEC